MAQVIMSTAGRYEVQGVGEFGQVYKWHPETVVVECGCGERPTLTSSRTRCDECGADHTALIRGWLTARRMEEDVRPWRYSGNVEDTGLPY